MEIWKNIEGYEGLYQVSNEGRVKSLERNYNTKLKHKTIVVHKQESIKKANDNGKGYLTVLLYKNGKEKRYLVHQLVAQAFIPNPNNYPIINHKNEEKTDNRVENLEWCTYEYNTNYGNAINKIIISKKGKANMKKRKPIIGINKQTKKIVAFNSAKEASEKLNVLSSNIYSALNGRIPSAYGYIWRFK